MNGKHFAVLLLFFTGFIAFNYMLMDLGHSGTIHLSTFLFNTPLLIVFLLYEKIEKNF
jgi:hypothetical protein